MRFLAALLVVVLCGCNLPGPGMTGIAAGVQRETEAPIRPLADPATATFAFLPVPGIPGNVGDDLLRRLWDVSEDEGLTVVKRPGGRATFFVEGNLSAVSDDTNALIFYVFDVKDVTGRRLYRIYGQQTTNDADADPWSNAEASDLNTIARRVVVLLKAWLNAAA